MSHEPIVTLFSLHAKQNNLKSGKTASDSQIFACLRTILAMKRKNRQLRWLLLTQIKEMSLFAKQQCLQLEHDCR